MQSDIIHTNKNSFFLEMCHSIVRSNNLVSFMKCNSNIDIKYQNFIITEDPFFRMDFDDFNYSSFQKVVQVIINEIYMIMDKISSKKNGIIRGIIHLFKYMSSTALSYINS